jgi:hypothetical protein
VIPRVRVVEKPGAVVRVEGAAVHCFGYGVLGREGVAVPEPVPGVLNILLIHAAVRSSARPGWPNPYYGGPGAFDVARAEGFDIVAAGDYHEHAILSAPTGWRLDGYGSEGFTQCQPLAPVAFYPGSLERVSSNIWSEAAPKGWVLVDTDARTLKFVEVETRAAYSCDLANLCEQQSVEGLNLALTHLIAEVGYSDSLLRMRATLPASERSSLDHSLVRQLHQRCVHFRLDVEWVGDEAQGEVRAEQRGLSLEDLVEQYAEGEDPAVAARMRAFLGLGEPVLEEVTA